MRIIPSHYNYYYCYHDCLKLKLRPTQLYHRTRSIINHKCYSTLHFDTSYYYSLKKTIKFTFLNFKRISYLRQQQQLPFASSPPNPRSVFTAASASSVVNNIMSNQSNHNDNDVVDCKGDDANAKNSNCTDEESIENLANILESTLSVTDQADVDTTTATTTSKLDSSSTTTTTKEREKKQQPQPPIPLPRENVPIALQQFADWIRDGTTQRILVVSGAGISVSAGIPDFRTPGTGLYDNLQKYKLPYPEAVFDLSYYVQNPYPFCQLAQEIWPGGSCHSPIPTVTHVFISMLATKKLLLRSYTQNIDGLEYLANVLEEYIVECHGHFRSATCISCGTIATDMEYVKRTIVDDGKVPICSACNDEDSNNNKNDNVLLHGVMKKKKKNQQLHPSRPSYLKPDIVFFGENLPNRFHHQLPRDLKEVDCVLVLGTSLQVAPVSNIPDMVPKRCKRILLNREYVGNFQVKNHKNQQQTLTKKDMMGHRDLFHPGDCDDSILLLSDLLGWKEELLETHEKIKIAMRESNNKNNNENNKK